jgi:hypothetical protein
MLILINTLFSQKKTEGMETPFNVGLAKEIWGHRNVFVLIRNWLWGLHSLFFSNKGTEFDNGTLTLQWNGTIKESILHKKGHCNCSPYYTIY